MSDERYLYSVNPKRPIKTIPDVLPIRSPRSLSLSKEEVKECLKYGSVYRRFANEKRLERVTILNVDRLHNAAFMTEEEYEVFKDKEENSTGKVVVDDTVAPELPVDTNIEVASVNEDPVIVGGNEVAEETTTEPEKTQNEESIVAPELPVDTNIEVASGSVEENSNDDTPTEAPVEEKKENNYNKYNNSKNNRHR